VQPRKAGDSDPTPKVYKLPPADFAEFGAV
jgi:hypothetical protein